MKLKSDGVYFEVPGLMCWVENGMVYAADEQNTQKYGRATKTNLDKALVDCKKTVRDWQRDQC